MREVKTVATMIRQLEKRFSKNQDSIHAMDREAKSGYFIISAENGDTIGGFPVADYYDAAYVDPKEKKHIGGINRKLITFCEIRGWRLDWENPGCLAAYYDN